MRRANIIFGRLGYNKRVLKKFAKIYINGDNIIVPFTFSSMIFGKKYTHYDVLNKKLSPYNNLHIHVLSGSCHYLYNFMEKYPYNKEKVKTQIFDSPCHIKGVIPSLQKMHNIPPVISEKLINTIFQDCIKTSDSFTNKSLLPNIPTGIIKSYNDIIAPDNAIQNLIENWNKDCKSLHILETKSNHLESYKDDSEQYISFCNKIIGFSEKE